MPKSGTWYLICFFWSYNEALKGKLPDLANALKEMEVDADPALDSLGINVMHTVHCVAPGYEEANDPSYALWKDLQFYATFYNFGSRVANQYSNPIRNKNAKIIYIYRNPLDQFLSMFNHLIHHSELSYRYMKKNGKEELIKSLPEFIFEASGIDSYIKQYHSFVYMKKNYPDNFLLVTYEDLMKNPDMILKRMLEFLGNPVITPTQQDAFRIARALTLIDSMKKIEEKSGRPLGEIQHPGHKSHIKSGKIGNWKKHISSTEINEIERRFNKFGYSIYNFTCGPSLTFNFQKYLLKIKSALYAFKVEP